MIVHTGVFKSRAEAERATLQLHALGIAKDRIITLTPEATPEELSSVPTTEGEPPGMIKALGAIAGGVVGAGIVEALAVFLIPGAGPVLAIGVIGAALIGALSGGAAGKVFEESVFGVLPEQELFFYEDALRQCRTVVIVMADGDRQAHVVRGALECANAETIDEARKHWWLGIRDVEKERYVAPEGNFEQDEHLFQAGFEAAQRPNFRDKSFGQNREELAKRYPKEHEREAFGRGYQRGAAYRQGLFQEQRHAP